jgi:hypothetical protein
MSQQSTGYGCLQASSLSLFLPFFLTRQVVRRIKKSIASVIQTNDETKIRTCDRSSRDRIYGGRGTHHIKQQAQVVHQRQHFLLASRRGNGYPPSLRCIERQRGHPSLVRPLHSKTNPKETNTVHVAQFFKHASVRTCIQDLGASCSQRNIQDLLVLVDSPSTSQTLKSKSSGLV